MWIAHKNEDGQREQSILEHLKGTANRAQEFANPFGCGEYGRCLGMLHDIGKYSEGFRERILNGGGKVDHSTAGAQLVWELSNTLNARIASYCVAGHHTGLPDGGSAADHEAESTLSARLQRPVEDYQAFRQEIDPSTLLPTQEPPLRLLGKAGFTISFFTRMLYSCLVDADFLDTERFMSNGSVARDPGEPLPILRGKLAQYLKKFDHPQNDLNRMRCNILNRCLQMAENGRGLFTLTVPTGGGKTLSSLAFALEHAKHNEQRRVIYVIPYTSIIEQTAEEFRTVLGDRNVLEHQHNFQYDYGDDRIDPRRLAAENWDKPVIVTTNVQFFESLFANKSSRCRKLHNIAGSVIIFDEAQMLPREYLIPCVRAISELVQNYGCTAVLCTATQPALDGVFADLKIDLPINEICPNVPENFETFRRTKIAQHTFDSTESLTAELTTLPQVLCIVNRIADAQKIYQALPKDGAYCLTTHLCPAHRKARIKEIRERLKIGLPCRVVSTSLIEAGVDVDFPRVYREEAGLDSVLQAAGRCNREGKRPLDESLVTVFTVRNTTPPPYMRQPAAAMKNISKRMEDITSLAAIRAYFEFYRDLYGKEDLDREKILMAFENEMLPFASVAEKVRVIESCTTPVYIPIDQGEALVERLYHGERSRTLFRKLGQYSVNVYPQQLAALREAGAVQSIDGGALYVLADPRRYDSALGLTLDQTETALFI